MDGPYPLLCLQPRPNGCTRDPTSGDATYRAENILQNPKDASTLRAMPALSSYKERTNLVLRQTFVGVVAEGGMPSPRGMKPSWLSSGWHIPTGTTPHPVAERDELAELLFSSGKNLYFERLFSHSRLSDSVPRTYAKAYAECLPTPHVGV